MIATTTNNRVNFSFYAIYCSSGDINIYDLGSHIATSACWSLPESFEDAFVELVTVENPRLAVGISTLVQIYKYFRFGRPYCYFWSSVVVEISWKQDLILSLLWSESYTS